MRKNRSEPRSARSACRTAGTAGGGPRLHRQQAFALHALARKLARPADRFRLLARLFLGGFFVVAAELHLAENALALHLLLHRLEGLVGIVGTDENVGASFVLARYDPGCAGVRRSPLKRVRAGSPWAAPVAESA